MSSGPEPTSPAQPPKDFFVSYTGGDRTWAEWIAFTLEEAGYTTVIQAWDSRPGMNFVAMMHDATKQTERTIAVLSAAYLKSEFGFAEWAVAFRRDPAGRQQQLVPVRIEACEVQGLLGPIVYLDLVGLDETQAKEQLLAGIKQGRAKPLHAGFPGSASPQDSDVASEERTLYLQHIIQTTQWLILPGGREVPLERLYVSLHADEMSVKERQAEHALYLQEVAALSQEARSRLPDPYIEFAAMRKVIARYPKMFMLDARNWPRLFGEREQQSLTLAEVVKSHRQAVLLGDPGSGKTTLGKWLVLQFACACSRKDTQVCVLAALVDPGEETEKETKALDLGQVKLPVLVSIAQYARVRKPKDLPDRGLTLYEYLRSGLFLDPLRLPPGLSQEVAGALVTEALRQRQALIVLDGLDEVVDPTRRRKIMAAVRRFLEEWCPLEPTREEHFIVSDQSLPSDRSGNRIVITSRQVGYQFDPLVDLPHYTVEEMDAHAIKAFCHAWTLHMAHPAVSPREVSQWAEQLYHAIFSDVHPGVKSMAGNPLLLTLIAQFAWEMRTSDRIPALPVRRVALFEKVERSFYDQRESLWEQAGIKPEQLTQAFGAVAYGLHASETAGFAPEEEVRQHLRSVLTGEVQIQAVLDGAREVSGFLIARGEGVYGFLHRSVQEYFAAQHLVSQSKQVEQVTSTLLAHAFDPLWREPVVLVIGLMSRPRYSEKLLSALFTALLDLPDPASEILPRRELLAVAACAECEMVPEGIGQRIAERLLSFYAAQIRLSEGEGLTQRIEQAFTTFQQSAEGARREVEAALSTAIQSEAFEQRYAAITLVSKTKWDSPAIAEALVVAWHTYADPAGSILVALEGLSEREPASFQSGFLPLRQRMEEKPWLWEKAKASQGWQQILRILYLTRGSDFILPGVCRDSPLTEQVIAALEQSISDSEAFTRFQKRLRVLAEQPGTAVARDAALALSALGDTEWIGSWEERIGDQKHLVYPIIAALAFARNLRLLGYIADSLYRKIDFWWISILARDFSLEPTLAQARTIAYRIADEIIRASNLAGDLACTDDLVGDFACDLDLAHDLGSEDVGVIDSIRICDIINEAEQCIQVARLHWMNDTHVIHDLDRALSSIETLKQHMGLLAPVANVWAVLVSKVVKRDEAQRGEAEPLQMTPETLEMLINHLACPDEKLRDRARREMSAERPSSILGKPLIETIALRAKSFRANTLDMQKVQIGTQLEWALNYIAHDRPDWISIWIDEASQSRESAPAMMILENIHVVTSETFETLVQAVPITTPNIREALLESLKWLVCTNQVPKERLSSFAEQLLQWLDQETNETIHHAILGVLGAWQEQETVQTIGMDLLKRLDMSLSKQDDAALALTLAHLARQQSALLETVRTALLQRKTTHLQAAALAYLCALTAQRSAEESLPVLDDEELLNSRKNRQVIADTVLTQMKRYVPMPLRCFSALIEAGSDDDEWDSGDNWWNDDYHRVLVLAAQRFIEHAPEVLAQELLGVLLDRLQCAIEVKDWPMRRMALAVVAACAETMPTTLRQTGSGKLESLLVRGTVDAESFNSRRFALTALSYLRTATADVVPALLAGCQDTEEVQYDTIEAASRFQRIEGDLLPALLPALTGESVSTAYAVAYLLGALGTSAAGTSAGLHEPIIAALVEALKDPGCKRIVTIAGWDRGTLENVLYDVLLQVAGWIG